MESYKMNPFLRWVGGKTRSIVILKNHLPPDFLFKGRYYEPFLGAGSLFFSLKPRNAVLSDNNKDLIECYIAVKENPYLLARYLNQHLKNTCKEYYYEMRHKYNNSKPSISRAALLIYLNKTCFNGIWRVNKDGKFNVPYGFKEPPSLPSIEKLLEASLALANAELLYEDYKTAVENTGKGDFVYFDPPYPPLNGTSNFTHYTKERFTKQDHCQLALISKELTNKGCFVLISYSDTDYIRSLYKDNFNIFELEVTRWIRTDGKRYKVREIVITNYNIQ